jgi:hypothetical protein
MNFLASSAAKPKTDPASMKHIDIRCVRVQDPANSFQRKQVHRPTMLLCSRQYPGPWKASQWPMLPASG